MKLFPEVWFRPRTNPSNFGGDLGYDPDPEFKTSIVSITLHTRKIMWHQRTCIVRRRFAVSDCLIWFPIEVIFNKISRDKMYIVKLKHW